MARDTMELATPDPWGDRRDAGAWERQMVAPNDGSGIQFFWGAERSGAQLRSFVRRPLGGVGMAGAGSPTTDYMSVGPRPMPEINLDIPAQEQEPKVE